MSPVINVEEDSIEMRSNFPSLLMSQLSLHLIILFIQLQNQENSLLPVHLPWNYLYHQLQNPTHTFLCKRPGHKLANVPPKARFSSFFHNEILFLLEAIVVRFIFMEICSQMKPYLWDAQMTILFSIGLQYLSSESFVKLEDCSIAQWNIKN